VTEIGHIRALFFWGVHIVEHIKSMGAHKNRSRENNNKTTMANHTGFEGGDPVVVYGGQ
jgi:hypothetical protein